jgi:NAD-dependent dihydropyrimidine dehydrogenase PreA subunit
MVAPFVDRNRCEGKADCVRVCPYGVFDIRRLMPGDRSALSIARKLNRAYVCWPTDERLTSNSNPPHPPISG